MTSLTVFTFTVLFLCFCGVQLETLRGDFYKLKTEYDTLLELHKGDSMQNEAHDRITDVQVN